MSHSHLIENPFPKAKKKLNELFDTEYKYVLELLEFVKLLKAIDDKTKKELTNSPIKLKAWELFVKSYDELINTFLFHEEDLKNDINSKDRRDYHQILRASVVLDPENHNSIKYANIWKNILNDTDTYTHILAHCTFKDVTLDDLKNAIPEPKTDAVKNLYKSTQENFHSNIKNAINYFRILPVNRIPRILLLLNEYQHLNGVGLEKGLPYINEHLNFFASLRQNDIGYQLADKFRDEIKETEATIAKLDWWQPKSSHADKMKNPKYAWHTHRLDALLQTQNTLDQLVKIGSKLTPVDYLNAFLRVIASIEANLFVTFTILEELNNFAKVIEQFKQKAILKLAEAEAKEFKEVKEREARDEALQTQLAQIEADKKSKKMQISLGDFINENKPNTKVLETKKEEHSEEMKDKKSASVLPNEGLLSNKESKPIEAQATTPPNTNVEEAISKMFYENALKSHSLL